MFKIIHKHNLAKIVTYKYSKRLDNVSGYFLNYFISHGTKPIIGYGFSDLMEQMISHFLCKFFQVTILAINEGTFFKTVSGAALVKSL
jgi:hypothetical protein